MFWYGLLALFPVLYGWTGVWATLHMGIVALVGVAAYKLLKHLATRERPYITHDTIDLAGAPLDRYSFPSGHTMHAVAFTMLAAYHVPAWLLPLAAFGVLVALSRVVLGLHYPTDVIAGGLVGGILASASIGIVVMVGPCHGIGLTEPRRIAPRRSSPRSARRSPGSAERLRIPRPWHSPTSCAGPCSPGRQPPRWRC